MRPSFVAIWIRSLTKAKLNELISEVKCNDPDATLKAVAFVNAESFGIWHNRARAKLCRHFKNHPPSADDRDHMVVTIANRLLEGRFYEQFKDQLSMAIRFSPDRLGHVAAIAANSDRDYIRRYGYWVQNVIESSSAIPDIG